MVMDTLGLVICVALLKAVENHPRVRALLPLTVLPVVGAGDLCCIYKELKAIHLRTLNRERAEMVAESWLATGRVPTAEEVRSCTSCACQLVSIFSCHCPVSGSMSYNHMHCVDSRDRHMQPDTPIIPRVSLADHRAHLGNPRALKRNVVVEHANMPSGEGYIRGERGYLDVCYTTGFELSFCWRTP
jgi:hypothetical protein